MTKLEKWLSGISGLMVLIIAGAAFWLSFNAIMDLAIKNGIPEDLAWLVPLVIDFAMIAFKVSVLRATIQGEKAYFEWGLIISFVILSVVYNIVHSEPTLVAQSLAAISPLALFAAFHVFVSQISATAKRSIVIQSIEKLESKRQNEIKLNKELQQNNELLNSQNEKLNEEIEQTKQKIEQKAKQEIAGLLNKRDRLLEEINQLSEQKESNQLDDTDRMLLQFVKVNPDASYREIGEFIERSASTVSNYVKRLSEQGLLHKNGNGYEVTSV